MLLRKKEMALKVNLNLRLREATGTMREIHSAFRKIILLFKFLLKSDQRVLTKDKEDNSE